MGKPLISFFNSSIRPNCWMRLYDSLKNNKTPFELVFCGDVKPTFKLPDNIIFIYSETKPAQCYHIAQKYTRGDIVAMTGDDFIFSDNSLDNIIKKFDKIGYENNIVLNYVNMNIRGVTSGVDLRFFGGLSETSDYNPLVGGGFFMLRSTWESIGGIDKRFLGLYWDLDVMMRAHSSGIKVFSCPDAVSTELKPEGKRSSVIPNASVAHDRIFAYSLWCVKKQNLTQRYNYDNRIAKSKKELRKLTKSNQIILLKERSMEVSSFEDTDDLLLVSQGPSGQWK